MRRTRFVLLMLVVLTFAASAVVAFHRHKQTADILAVSDKTSAWTLISLETEYLKFIQALQRYALEEGGSDPLRQRFEILWSRIDVALEGKESTMLRQNPDVRRLVDAMRVALAELEGMVFALEPGKTPAYERIRDRLEPFALPLRQAVGSHFRGREAYANRDAADEVHQEFGVYLFGLFLSGMAMIVFLLLESRKSRRQALHDSLTDLPNRLHFSSHLKATLQQAECESSIFAVHVIDLDGFKEVNDTLGHAAGDVLLKHVADVLSQDMRANDLVARLGGDEFAIIQTGIQSADCAAKLAQRISESIGHEVDVFGNSCMVAASIGISIYPQDTENPTQLLINADMAMYRAKASRNLNFCFFEPQMNSAILRRKALADDLRYAISNDELTLVYQPVIDLNSNRIVSVEALLRWQHDLYGEISPLELVSVAEMYGQSIALNEWVLEQACAQMKRWRQSCLPPIQMAVNISPGMYARGQLVESVTRILQRNGLRGEDLIIEVTEDTTMRDIDASPEILQGLRAQGIELALDDFGTGYSSLSHLKQLPVQRLKIDKSFVQDLGQAPHDTQFIHTIIQLGQSLGMKIVVEGVETVENLGQMRSHSCEMVQGYYFCRPSGPEEIARRLAQQSPEERGAVGLCEPEEHCALVSER